MESEEEGEEIPLVTDIFGELYFRESSSSSSSIGDLKFTPPLPLPKVPSDEKPNGCYDGVGYQNEIKSPVKEKLLPGKDSCMYNNSGKLFPPPISTLKMSRSGQPFTYQRFDEKANAFVREELKVPPRGVMVASRENGRLRMNFAYGQVEEEDDDDKEEEEEAMGAVTYDDGEQSDDDES